MLAGLTVPWLLFAVLLCFFFFPLGVSSSFLEVFVVADASVELFSEFALAAGMELADGVVPVAGGVLAGPDGVLADAPPLALPDAAGLDEL